MNTDTPTCSKRPKLHHLVSENNRSEMSTSSTKIEEKSVDKRIYNVWKNNCKALIPTRTMERWEKNKMEFPPASEDESVLEISPNTSDEVFSSDPELIECDDDPPISEIGSTIPEIDLNVSEIDFRNYDSESNKSYTSSESAFDLNEKTNPSSLYSSSNVSIEETVLKVLNMLFKHKLSKSAIKAQLSLINSILPDDHKMPKTLFHFFKFIENQAPPCKTIKHFFCKKCLIYISEDANICSTCCENNISFFFEIDIIEQIVRLFEINNIADKLMKVTFQDDFIGDIVDGLEYRRINSSRQQFDLTLILYTDGISLIKSSNSHCWPLMFVIAELPPKMRYRNIITAGVWYDNKIKPPMNLFLRPFCQQLLNHQIIKWKHPIDGQTKTSKIFAPLFIADAPARAQIQNILNFNGEYGCNICEIQTENCENKTGKKLVRVYPYKEVLKLREGREMENQGNMVEQTDNAHIKGVKGCTILSCLPNIDIGSCVLPEFMHSVLLGVTKQFLNLWLNKKGEWRIKKKIEKMDTFLLNIRPINTFGRLPRSLTNFYSYKASELFNWLMYYSLPTLDDNLPDVYLQHWMLLVIAIHNLVGERVKINNIQESEELLSLFVKDICFLYGNRELTYNVHQLLHLGLAVRRWGPLWATSAFPFEDQNGLIAKSVHGSRNLNTEIINNIKIAQGAAIIKNRVESYHKRLFENFKVIGKAKKFQPNYFQKALLLSEGYDARDTHFYARAKIQNKVFTSSSYKKIKTNSYTVRLKFNQENMYAIINCFVQIDNKFFLLIQHLNVASTTYFINKTTKSVVKHIIPFTISNNFDIIEITNEGLKAQGVQVTFLKKLS